MPSSSINAPRAMPVQPASVPTPKAVTPGASQSPTVVGRLGGQTIASLAPSQLPTASAARPTPGSVASRLALSERALTLADPDHPLAAPNQRMLAQARRDAALAQSERIPTGVKPPEVQALVDEGTSPLQMRSLAAQGCEPHQAGTAAQSLRDQAQAAENTGREPFRTAGFNDQEIRLMESAKMTLDEAQAYRESGTEINPHTLPKGRVDRGAELGAGAMSTAFQANLTLDGQAPSSGVIKALKKADPHPAGEVSGIDPKDANTAARNLGALALAKLLGFDVIVDTKVVLAGVDEGPKTPHLFMANAGATDADHSPAAVFDNPAVRREATKLQLVDCLIGAIDRTPANYFITVQADGSAQVTGIDNDQCFGQWLTHPDQVGPSHDLLPGSIDENGNTNKRISFRSKPVPVVIDSDMQTALNALTPADVRSLLLELNLTEPEVAATEERLLKMQELINDPGKTTVINPDDWSDPTKLASANKKNSLFASGGAWVSVEREPFLQEKFQEAIDKTIAHPSFGQVAKVAAGNFAVLSGDQSRTQCMRDVHRAVANEGMRLVEVHHIKALKDAKVPDVLVGAYQQRVAAALDLAAATDNHDGFNAQLTKVLNTARADRGTLVADANRLAANAP